MKVSHSKLNTILSCPMTYYLQYVVGINQNIEKPALSIGSAVHWGIENNTSDLEQYYKDNGTFNQAQGFTDDQLLAEAMVDGYFLCKDRIFKELLTDKETGQQLQLLDETHELFINGKLKSFKHPDEPHLFVGIIDLLLLTEKGWVLVDYKTSSRVPDWSSYIEQLYRYIFLLQSEFPDVPIYKLAIINIRKTGIRRKKDENEVAFLKRQQLEYSVDDCRYIEHHEFLPEDLDKQLLNNYITNLSKMVDAAETIVDNQQWFINYGAANGTYGKSQYWNIFYHTENAEALYNISDKVYVNNEWYDRRSCYKSDMLVIDYPNVMHKYEQYKVQALALYTITNDLDKTKLKEYIKKNFICDDELLDVYWSTLLHDIETQQVKLT